MSISRGLTRGSIPCHRYILVVSMLLLGSDVFGDDLPLERLRFFLFGQEKQEIGTSRALEGQLELRLFSPAVASHYTVLIPTSELISSSRIPPLEMARIRAEWIQLAEERKRKNEERRRLKALKIADGNRSKGSRRSPDSESQGDGVDGDARFVGTTAEEIQKISSNSEAKALLRRFGLDVEELVDRSGEKLIQVGSNLALVSDWVGKSARTPPYVRRLNSELLEIQSDIGRLDKRLGGRMGEITRYSLQVDRGNIRPRDLREIGENLKNRISFCTKNLDTIEARLGAATDAIVALPVPVAEEIEVEQEEPSRAIQSPARDSVKESPEVSSGSQVATVERVNAVARSEGRPAHSGGSISSVDRGQDAQAARGDSDLLSGEIEVAEPVLEVQEQEPDSEESGSGAIVFLVLGLLCGILMPTIYRWLVK